MARETKAERLAREAAENAAFEALQAATYNDRLMAMLERAANANWELTVQGGKLVLEDRDDRRASSVTLTLTYNKENQEALHMLDWRVELKEEEQREAERQRLARNAALAKLTPEERKLLGL